MLSGGVRKSLLFGALLLLGGLGGHSWLAGLAGLVLILGAGWIALSAARKTGRLTEPWPWPADLRSQAEALARPIDPTPKRTLPPDEKSAIIAHVATTGEAVSRLSADKPPAWPWALFTSVLLQRRNAVGARLRRVASGYQPGPGVALTGQAYSRTAQGALSTVAGVIAEMEQFMLSPAFKGAFGGEGDSDRTADADAVVGIADRLMDYHETLLVQAETCLQTPVEHAALTFVQDAGAVATLPLIGYDQFISTMCARIGQAQDLLPYTTGGAVQLDDVNLSITLPDGLDDRILAHMKRFNP